MEKTLKREIGYKKGKSTMNVVKPVKLLQPKLSAPPVKKQIEPSTAKYVVAWLKAHPFIAWMRVCKAIGIDPGNFQRELNSENPSIKPENIVKIETALKPYGYE